jgi:hypothetical protein
MTKKMANIKIPKGTKCKNGICEQDLELDLEIDIPEVKPIAEIQPTASAEIPQQKSVNQKDPGMVNEKIIEKAIPPNYLPKYKCKDGNCGQAHENPYYDSPVKGICQNCKQFSPLESGKCYWCNDEVEPLEIEELDDLGIPLPKEKSEDHIHAV